MKDDYKFRELEREFENNKINILRLAEVRKKNEAIIETKREKTYIVVSYLSIKIKENCEHRQQETKLAILSNFRGLFLWLAQSKHKSDSLVTCQCYINCEKRS